VKFIDMFAGIGGFRSGLEQAGHKCVGYVEWDKFARQSYQAMYDTRGEFADYDIQRTKGIKLPEADLWTFGSPCTNISIAGNRTGIGGEQSRMFFEVIRLLKERAENQKTLPTYLIMENVKNLLSSNEGRDFAEVIYQMDKVGYDAEWCVFDSAEVVPQHRERIYIVGHLRGKRTERVFPIQRQSKGANRKPKINTLYKEDHYNSDTVIGIDGISPTIVASSYKNPQKIELNKNKIKQVGKFIKTASFGGNLQVGRVYDPSGVSPTLNTMQGGNRQPKI
jgi:DNA (cytosine-5)-methyltransferase 1